MPLSYSSSVENQYRDTGNVAVPNGFGDVRELFCKHGRFSFLVL
jgi:hypothetical protein